MKHTFATMTNKPQQQMASAGQQPARQADQQQLIEHPNRHQLNGNSDKNNSHPQTQLHQAAPLRHHGQQLAGNSSSSSNHQQAGRQQQVAGLQLSAAGALHGSGQVKKELPANGKKTKGRVRIKMEFIHNKLRRYTTFSKRKTGIMKKVNREVVRNLRGPSRVFIASVLFLGLLIVSLYLSLSDETTIWGPRG